MKVKCLVKEYITDTSPVFIKPYSVSKNEDSFVTFSHGTTTECGVEYPVFVGAEYVVYGIMVQDSRMYYLISFEESNMPDWIPSSLFEIRDPTTPCFWVIQTTFEKNDNILFILSHYEIATDFNHMLGLLQGVSSDFKNFRKSMLEY